MGQAFWTAKTSRNVSESFEKERARWKKRSEWPSLVSRTILHDVISNDHTLGWGVLAGFQKRLRRNTKKNNQNRDRKIVSRAFGRKIKGLSNLYGDRRWNLDFIHDPRNQETADAVPPYRLSCWKNFKKNRELVFSVFWEGRAVVFVENSCPAVKPQTEQHAVKL